MDGMNIFIVRDSIHRIRCDMQVSFSLQKRTNFFIVFCYWESTRI